MVDLVQFSFSPVLNGFGCHYVFYHSKTGYRSPVFEWLLEYWSKNAQKPLNQTIVSGNQMVMPFENRTSFCPVFE
jgi:hypothetical protein